MQLTLTQLFLSACLLSLTLKCETTENIFSFFSFFLLNNLQITTAVSESLLGHLGSLQSIHFD